MSVEQLLTKLRDLDIKIWVEGEKLRYSAPQGVLTDDFLSELASYKKEITDWLKNAVSGNSINDSVIEPASRDRDLPPSYSQERLLFVEQLVPDTNSYNVPVAVKFKGALDVEAFEKSLNEIVSRHESLRTRFTTRNGQHFQIIEPKQPIKVVVVPIADNDDVIPQVEKEKSLPFNLSTGPLLRCKLFRITEQEHILVLTLHHLVCDGWSLGLLFKELRSLYGCFSEGGSVSLPELRIQYADYAVWQREFLTGHVFEEQLDYWRDRLNGLSTLQLPTDRPRPPVQSFQGGFIIKELPLELSSRLRALSEKEEATIFMTLLSAFTVLLRRYCGQDDIVVGTPIANRNRHEIEDLIGFFNNMLVLRIDLSGTPSFRELLSQVKSIALGAYHHQDLPFEKLVSDFRLERDLSRNPIFQVSFAMQNAPLAPAQLKGLTTEAVRSNVGTSRFDLEVNLWENDQGMVISCVYNSDLFEAPTIDRMLAHYQQLLGSVVENPDQSIDDFRLLLEEEQQQFVDWNQTATDYLRDKTVVELFEQQAAASPDAIALEYEDQTLSYRELNERANRLAHYLIAAGVKPDLAVVVLMERTPDLVIAQLAVLKAGAAYVAVDPDYPIQRLAFILADTRSPVLLTQSNLSERVSDYQGQTLCLDSDSGTLADQGIQNPAVAVNPDNLAYVIYTSGSTGTPKGVEVPHGGLMNLVSWHRRAYEVSSADRATHLAGLGFDASVWELWPYLTSGASLYLVSDERRLAPTGLWSWMATQGITLSFLPTPLAEAALRAPIPEDLKLRVLLTGGDRLHGGLVKKPVPFRVVNHYGPTENSVVTTFTEVDVCSPEDPPIGRPIDNVQTYILDKGLQPVPLGIWGELYIGGEGLARGYLNQPELTAEKFIPNPFSNKPGARLYRSGDLVRYREDGQIEFQGRIDHQVKVRGFRVELGEIESVLSRQPGIKTAVVLVQGDEQEIKRLVAYLIFNHDQSVSVDVIRNALQAELPAYMVPSAFIMLDELPLTPNGKLDRDALPALDVDQIAGEEYLAPRGELETRITEIWRDLLGMEKVGIRDNFFDLGGHSLLMSQVQARLTKELDRKIPMLDLFQYPTIESLSRHLGGENEQTSAIEKARARMAQAGVITARDHDEAIAIIGMAGRFPGAASVEQFWENLANGVESVRFFTDEELTAAGIPEQLIADPRYVPAKGYLDDADLFDAAFFGYPPREAELLDPQQRIFLECAWEALERAGYDPERYQGLIGVYAGSSTNSYRQNLNSHPDLVGNLGLQVAISSDKDFLPTRVSYKLNLHGPSVTVQTACSTSLVAIHEACKSLLGNECDIALAGGVSVSVPRVHGYMYQDESILSPDGHCRAFSADAMGTVGGEGVGIVVLKRLSVAEQDGDIIHAVIRGSAINNDGSNKVGYTAPSVEGQTDVIALAQAAAGVSPSSISYIETHGTGTSLGDPIEMAALTRVFDDNSNDARSRCAIGAVKTNIGHLDTAAGVAGVIKAALSLKHGQVPPSLNFSEPNPEIDFESASFYVNTELKPWEVRPETPRRAGVSSFGIGGTNAHAVLEQAPTLAASESGREWQLLPISAKNEAAFEQSKNRVADYLEQNPDANLADVSYTLRTGRGEFEYRGAAIGNDSASLVAALRGTQGGRWWTNRDVAGSPPVIFMFPGQGSQYARMGQDLYETETVFREIVDHCCKRLKYHIDVDLRDIIFARSTDDTEAVDAQLRQTLMAQCSLFVIEYALAKLWMSWGIQPAAMIGHSIGEYVAACIAGAINLDEALLLIASRGKAMAQAPVGAMLSVPLPEQQVIAYLSDDLWLSVINAHSASVVSGAPEAIGELEQRLQSDGIETLRLHTSGAFHSGLMDGVVPRLVDEAKKLNISRAAIPYISNVTGSWIEAAQLEDPQYWGQHLRNTVRFAEGVDVLLEKYSAGVFLEVGPGKTLSSMLRQSAADANTDVEILSSLRHPRKQLADGETFAGALAGLWLRGVSIDWQFYDQHSRRCKVELPTYPFQRQSYWVELATGHAAASMTTIRRPLEDWFYIPEWKSSRMPANSMPIDLSGGWIVFANESASCAAIIAYIEKLGGNVIRITAADGFSMMSSSSYTIDPSRKEDYERLFSDAEISFEQARGIIHCWGMSGGRDGNRFEAAEVMQLGYYSLLYTAQALVVSGKNPLPHVDVLTQYSQSVDQEDKIAPEKSMVTALLRVISQENIGFKYTLYDVLDAEIEAQVKQQEEPEKLPVELQSIFNLSRRGTENRVVVFRRKRRWLQIYDRITLNQTQPDQLPLHLRERGVYLITGGLGKVGFVFANYLATEVRARLILTTRTQLPERSEWDHYLQEYDNTDKLSWIMLQVRHLEAAGAEVIIANVDVSYLSGMQQLVDKVNLKYGQINGVIHGAGVVSGSSMASMQSLTYEDCELQFAPKVYGLMVLKQLFDDYSLDFIMPVSSLSSVLGGLGFAAYSAANQFMDSFCQQQHNQGNTQWISVDWDGWLFDEIDAIGAPLASTAKVASDSLSLTAEEGKNVFREILNSPVMPQVIISTGDLDTRLMQWVYSQPGKAAEEAADNSRYERPELSCHLEEAKSQSQIQLSEIWKRLFKYSEIGMHDDFFELGGDSLLAIQVVAEIREKFNTSLSIDKLFELSTIDKLASHLEALEWLKFDAEEKFAGDETRKEFEL